MQLSASPPEKTTVLFAEFTFTVICVYPYIYRSKVYFSLWAIRAVNYVIHCV